MAKFKKAGKKTGPSSAQAQADQLSKKLSESAQQVWLAGVGAFGRAQAEGTKLFEALVKEGMNFEQSARRFAGGRADQVRDAVESRVGEARDRANDTWDRLEKVFEDRVQRALVKLNVPGREDLADLATRVDAVTAELRRQNGGAAPRKRAGKSAAKKATTGATAKRTSTRKTAKTASGSRRPRKST
jgi:poly(hydroxyalkanoate) granule-associated protein